MTEAKSLETAQPRWKDLYIVGGICGVLMSALTILGIVIYFVWPFKPGLTSPLDIFMTIQNDKLNGFMSLDLFFLLVNFITIPFFLALFFAVREVNVCP